MNSNVDTSAKKIYEFRKQVCQSEQCVSVCGGEEGGTWILFYFDSAQSWQYRDKRTPAGGWVRAPKHPPDLKTLLSDLYMLVRNNSKICSEQVLMKH